MISKATLRYLRVTPRKFRLIVPLVKGKNAEEAVAILVNVKKGAAKYAIDLINSALANAKRKQQGIDLSTVYISNLIVNHGPMLKRYRAASMGRASPIHKHTSHVTVELSEAKKPEAGEVKHKETHVKEGSGGQGPGPRKEKQDTAKKTTHKEAPKKEAHHKKGKE